MSGVRRTQYRKNKRVANQPPSFRSHRGSLLLEAMIAIGVFTIFLGGIGLALVLGERTTIVAGDRTRAAFLAEQQLEAVREMRATDFASVTTGQHGLALGATGWSWSGTLVQNNGYTSWVTVTSKGEDWLEIESNVHWNFGNTRSGSILLTTQLTDWNAVATVGNWAAMTNIAETPIAGSPKSHTVLVHEAFAYITGDTATGGQGLYIYDVSNPASPVRVASAFDLGASAYGMTAVDTMLYITTSDPTNEVQVYDITDPTNLTTANLISSYDLAGSGNARSIAVYGSNIFVGTIDDPPHDQLYAIHMSESGSLSLASSLTVSGSVLGITLHEGYAYLANSFNVGEMQVIDVFDPENLTFAPDVGIDMTDVHDAIAIMTTGTSALIGRVNGASIDELTLYDIALSPVPTPPPGPWTLEVGGDVTSLATVFGNAYVFVGGSASNAQIKVLDLARFARGDAPVIESYDTNATIVSLYYDWLTDRLFAVSTDTLFVFAPG